MKKKAILAYQYGMDNAGDFAIVLGAIDLLLTYYEKVVLISKYTDNQKEYLEAKIYIEEHYEKKVELYPGPFCLNREGVLSLLKSYIKGIVNLINPRLSRKYTDLMCGAEDIYINGGNLLRCNSITDWIRLQALFYPVKIARRCHIPVTFLPQSTAIINKLGYMCIKRNIKTAKCVMVREAVSYKYFREIFPDVEFVQSMDMAFFITDNIKWRTQSQKKYPWLEINEKKPVAITLRKEKIGDIGHLDDYKISLIRKRIIELIRELYKEEIPIVIVVQSKKDRDISMEIYNKIKVEMPKINISFIEEHDPLILREIYRKMSILVGMRLHSIILAASVGVPVVGYFEKEWGNKNPGMMQLLGMPYAYLDDDMNWNEMLSKAVDNQEVVYDSIKIAMKDFRDIVG